MRISLFSFLLLLFFFLCAGSFLSAYGIGNTTCGLNENFAQEDAEVFNLGEKGMELVECEVNGFVEELDGWDRLIHGAFGRLSWLIHCGGGRLSRLTDSSLIKYKL